MLPLIASALFPFVVLKLVAEKELARALVFNPIPLVKLEVFKFASVVVELIETSLPAPPFGSNPIMVDAANVTFGTTKE